MDKRPSVRFLRVLVSAFLLTGCSLVAQTQGQRPGDQLAQRPGSEDQLVRVEMDLVQRDATK